jgi:hypothetical protein
MVLNATFNNIPVISWQRKYPKISLKQMSIVEFMLGMLKQSLCPIPFGVHNRVKDTIL